MDLFFNIVTTYCRLRIQRWKLVSSNLHSFRYLHMKILSLKYVVVTEKAPLNNKTCDQSLIQLMIQSRLWYRNIKLRVYEYECCVVLCLCGGLITRPEEFYHVSVCVWSRNPEKGGQRSTLDYKCLWMNGWMRMNMKTVTDYFHMEHVHFVYFWKFCFKL
jgi:hypothetical protein